MPKPVSTDGLKCILDAVVYTNEGGSCATTLCYHAVLPRCATTLCYHADVHIARALHKKSWAVIDRPYKLESATVGALYERP